MAFAAMTALARRATQGGSWHVRCSLAQTGHWFRNLGRIDGGLALPDPALDDGARPMEDAPSGFGRLTAVRHSAVMSETPAALGAAVGAARHARAELAGVES